ncbi:MAG: hypothetical protein M3024_14300 [Candidatus Dormibacteraeota bacterium]|nr:hypothetical protein [Candidatus Dormibacteraeota bacterium]
MTAKKVIPKRRHWRLWLLGMAGVAAWLVWLQWGTTPFYIAAGVLVALGLLGMVAKWHWREKLRPWLRQRLARLFERVQPPRARARSIAKRWSQDEAPTAEAVGLPGSKLTVLAASTDMLEFRLSFAGGKHTTENAVLRLPNIDGALRVPSGASRIRPDESNAGRCFLTVITRDRLAEPIPWPGSTVAMVTDAVTLGLYEDLSPVELRLTAGHALVGGQTNAGKSSILQVILSSLVRCQDAALWLCDPKQGMELGGWAPAVDRVATTLPAMVDLLRAANCVLDARAQSLGARGSRLWQPSPGQPLLFVVVDELAELPPECLELVDRLARLGRAPGIRLICCTQRPSGQALGGVGLRTQLAIRVCLKVAESGDVNLILGPGRLGDGWRAERLGPPGSFYLLDDAHPSPRPARGFHITDGDLAAVWSQATPTHLDEPSQAAAEWIEDAAPELVEPLGATEARNATPRPHDRVLAVLAAAGEGGLGTAELMAQSGRSKTRLHGDLQALLDAGQVCKLGYGRWAQSSRVPEFHGSSEPSSARVREAQR